MSEEKFKNLSDLMGKMLRPPKVKNQLKNVRKNSF
jgi:hypothetical protein